MEQAQLSSSDAGELRRSVIKIKLPWLGEFEIRGFTAIMIVLIVLMGVNCTLLGLHLWHSDQSQKELVKTLKHFTVMQSFQSCIFSQDIGEERRKQLTRGSDCWFFAQGFDYGKRIKED